MPDDQTDRLLQLIRQYESPGGNVRNYKYSEVPDESGKIYTAQGYYQLTNENWNKIAPQLGIDTKKFPNAMSASEEDQRKVAAHLLSQPDGIRNWSDYNPRLKAALGQPGDTKPMAAAAVPNQKISLDDISADTDLSNVDPEHLKKLRDQLQAKIKKSQQPQVKAPPGSWQEFVNKPDIETHFYNPYSYVERGVQDVARGVMGQGDKAGSDWKTRAADVLEGVGNLGMPVAELLAIPEVAAAGVSGGAMAALRAASPYIKGFVGSQGGSWGATRAADFFDADEKTKRLVGDVGGFAGTALARVPDAKIMDFVKNPKVQAAAMFGTGAAFGHPYLGAEAAAARLGLSIPGWRGKIISMMGGTPPPPPPATGATGATGTPATGTVAPPPGMKPPTPEKIQELYKRGSIDPKRMDELLKGGTLTAQELAQDAINQHHEEAWGEYKDAQAKQAAEDKAAAEKQADIQRRAADKEADRLRKEEKERQEKAFELVRTGEGGPSLSTSALSGTTTNQPVHVKLPSSNITVHGAEPAGPVNLPQGGFQQQQGMFPQMPQTPVGQFTPPQPNIPVQMTEGRPFMPRPNVPPVAEQTPVAQNLKTPSEDFEEFASSIAKAAYKAKQRPVVTSNDMSVKGIMKKFGLDRRPTRQHLERARDLYDDLVRGERPTPNNPGKGER